MEKFFKLKENGTSVSTEIMAGLTTFFAMSYIIVVNPSILSESGMEWGAVFLATIISAVIGVPLGITAGYFGGWLDMVIMRVVDVLYAMPNLLFVIIISIDAGITVQGKARRISKQGRVNGG